MKNFKSITTFILVTALLSSCGSKDKKGMQNTDETPMVQVQSVFAENVAETSDYSATVEAFKTNNISSNNGARIKRLLVDVGSFVRAGQSVVILDDTNVDQQRIAIDQQNISLANVKRDLDRAKELLKIGGGTQQAVDQLQAQYDAQARAIDASRRSLQNMRENTVLTSPVSGVVTQRNYNNGDLPAGLPILVIEQQQPLKVIVNVNESDFPKVHRGMGVEVRLDTYGDEVFPGQVYLIHPAIDPSTRTFQVEVTIPNANNRVHSGMFARVLFNYGTKRNVVVPDRAIQKQTGSGVRYVYVFNNGTVEFREVQLGQRMENRYEVLGGLNGGTQVVVEGQSRLSNGARVQVAK